MNEFRKSEFGKMGVPTVEYTFGHLDALHRFVVNRSGTLLNQFITLDANIDHFGSFDTELDKFLRDLMNNVSCCLICRD